MCGISAVCSASSQGELRASIARMVAIQAHRGPDGNGSFVDEVEPGAGIALGHNRLSIIDLTDHAAQPMRSRDGRYVIVYNGEVYNYREIARELAATDLPEGSCGDTAVVLAALARWGADALPRFNGMWALLLYDTVAKTLLVSRDRFGVKPLYYLRQGDTCYWASEIKAILAASGARLPINPGTAIPYLTRGLLNFSDETFFSGVKQFPPASYQVIDLRRPEGTGPVRRYWWHPVERNEEPVEGMVSPEELRSVFLDAVALRMRSDAPVGLTLSGGVDSSAILGAIAEIHALDNLTILSVVSDNPAYSEERFIDVMGRFVGLAPQKINVSSDPGGLLAGVGDACWYNDEPVTSMSAIAHQRMMASARARGIKVLLSGQGADEQLGGYNKFLYFWLASLARQGHYLRMVRLLAQSAWHSDTLYEFRLNEARRYVGRRQLSRGSFIAPTHQQLDTLDIGLQGSFARREWVDLTVTSVPALLHYEDRMSMSQSVEVRVPFLDVRMVECLARVHPSAKFAGGWTKSIFRTAIDGLVPREIQYRRDKKGFTMPEEVWMRAELRHPVRQVFEGPMMAADLGLVDRARLCNMHNRFLAGDGRLTARHFFRVYALEMFLRRFADNLDASAAVA